MAYNHAGAEKAYALQQEENRKQYRAAGMSDEEIQVTSSLQTDNSWPAAYRNTKSIWTLKQAAN